MLQLTGNNKQQLPLYPHKIIEALFGILRMLDILTKEQHSFNSGNNFGLLSLFYLADSQFFVFSQSEFVKML